MLDKYKYTVSGQWSSVCVRVCVCACVCACVCVCVCVETYLNPEWESVFPIDRGLDIIESLTDAVWAMLISSAFNSYVLWC